MALVAAQGNNRLAAVLLLFIAVILVYLLCFHWFILRHVEYSTEISELSEQLGRYQRVAEQKVEYESLLRDLEARRPDQSLFLGGEDFNEAAAEMSESLGRMINTQAEETCQIVSRQPVRPRVQERYEKVTVNVRMRCGIEDFRRIMYSLETSVPMVIADEITVIKPRARRRNRNNENQRSALDIRFNMSGYLGSGRDS